MALALALGPGAVTAAQAAPAAIATTGPPGPAARVIVAWRDGAPLARQHPWARTSSPIQARLAAQRRADALGRRSGLSLYSGRIVGQRAQVMKASGLDSAALARRLSADPEVAWAVVDHRRRALMVPNDPLFAAGPAVNLSTQTGGPEAGQWYLRAPTEPFLSATHAQEAWSRSTGAGVVVAVLDTGVRFDHEDLQGQLLPGYDMVLDTAFGNDGDGRDADASDPGDWVTTSETNDRNGPYFGCGALESSWHGTLVSGILAAATNNGLGMAGMAPGARVLPVRVLGKCGGYDSDIIAGMRWSVGLELSGIAANPHPARILNLSLGGEGACTQAYAEAVAEVLAAGALVVAAAGNSVGQSVGVPANCPGVMAVAGLRHAGTKVGFSDLGPEISIAAPGGNCVNTDPGTPCLYPIVSSLNSGLTVPAPGGSIYTDSFNFSVGTSFASPMVAATAALMLAVRPDLSPTELRSLLESTARPFPTSGADNGSDPTPVSACRPPEARPQLQCYCSVGLCGAGMLDASAAVLAALGYTRAGGGALSALWLLLLLGATGLLACADRVSRRPAHKSGCT